MDNRRSRSTPTAAGLLLGLGLGGFFDGIVFHQLLQWHHMVSSTDRWRTTTVRGLEVNTLADGLFHAATYLLTAVGLALLWRAARTAHPPWSTRAFVGMLLAGWGLFNLVEGIVNHHVLGIHHVRSGDGRPAWDFAFLAWGAVMLAGGWVLARAGCAESPRRTTVQGARTEERRPTGV